MSARMTLGSPRDIRPENFLFGLFFAPDLECLSLLKIKVFMSTGCNSPDSLQSPETTKAQKCIYKFGKCHLGPPKNGPKSQLKCQNNKSTGHCWHFKWLLGPFFCGDAKTTPNMTGRRLHRTTEAIPRRPWKAQSPFASRHIRISIRKGTRGVRTRYDTVLLPFISIVRCPRSSSHTGHQQKCISKFSKIRNSLMLGLRSQPPCTGVPRPSGPEIPKKSQKGVPAPPGPECQKSVENSPEWPEKESKRLQNQCSGTFSTLFWHSGRGGPGTPLWDFLGISGPEGCGDSCIWGFSETH